VARALAEPEREARLWEDRFYHAMEGFRFLPAGRILAGAGTGRSVTLFNCFVMGTVPDDMGGIFAGLREAAMTMQQGGGIGYDFSTLRPKGAPVKGVGADASGPVSFMDVWDAMCRTIMSAGSRRGAMMATLRCDHPDIEAFIDAKREPGRLRNFNLSVLVTDPFMAAVGADASWPLVFDGRTIRTVRARDLWDRIMRATYDYAEPGVIFIDRINAANNLAYCETIAATNPCGEQPLPPYGACLLGSINLPTLVTGAFTLLPGRMETIDRGHDPQTHEQLWGALAGCFEFAQTHDYSDEIPAAWQESFAG
jgi:ribonucleoside-diphosphate reductase alpha chain